MAWYDTLQEIDKKVKKYNPVNAAFERAGRAVSPLGTAAKRYLGNITSAIRGPELQQVAQAPAFAPEVTTNPFREQRRAYEQFKPAARSEGFTGNTFATSPIVTKQLPLPTYTPAPMPVRGASAPAPAVSTPSEKPLTENERNAAFLKRGMDAFDRMNYRQVGLGLEKGSAKIRAAKDYERREFTTPQRQAYEKELKGMELAKEQAVAGKEIEARKGAVKAEGEAAVAEDRIGLARKEGALDAIGKMMSKSPAEVDTAELNAQADAWANTALSRSYIGDPNKTMGDPALEAQARREGISKLTGWARNPGTAKIIVAVDKAGIKADDILNNEDLFKSMFRDGKVTPAKIEEFKKKSGSA